MQKCPVCHRSNTGHGWVSPHFNVVQRGHLAVDINIASTDAMNLVFYGKFENTMHIHINSKKNVIYDYFG